ncbi:unnamed protein product [Miscanthus lutarioriparius]|uniref:Uncharacterized protein n=1 Tax=Miscanthus lutarioriparius TaxID=422564 RepID=A0A811SCJ4_9POAL|nr:unnamed protein product [Miscanthus lutarioriparius]
MSGTTLFASTPNATSLSVPRVLDTAMSIMLFGRLLKGFSWSKMAGVAAIDLSESRHNTFMARPLVLQAEPRLPAHLYPGISL